MRVFWNKRRRRKMIMPTNKYKVQLRLSICFCTLTVLIFSILLYIGKEFLFTGVSAKDIHIETTRGTVPYNVTDIKETVNSDTNSEYVVTFTSTVDKTQPITMTVSDLGTTLQLGTEVMVDWVNVLAVYDKYVRSKDLVALQGSATIAEETIQKAETETRIMLEKALAELVHPLFKWFAILLVVLTAVVCFILVKQSRKISERWASADIWTQLSNQVMEQRKLLYDKTYFGIDTANFVLEECPEPKLPFRFWASTAEFNQYVAARGIQLDKEKISAKDKKTMNEDSESISKANALRRSRGVLVDINVSAEQDDGNNKTGNKHIVETQGVRRKAITGNMTSHTASRLPEGNRGTIKRRA